MKFRDAIEEIRSRADIVEIVGGPVALKRAGRNFKGLCPFHGEKTPSFVVSPDKQIYHCFGCGAGGSVFDFVMNFRNLTFPEAVEFLGSRVGVTIDPSDGGPSPSKHKHRKALAAVNAAASEFYHKFLLSDSGVAARDYLRGRGIDLPAIKQFNLGLAPNQWEALGTYLTKGGHELQHAKELGLVVEKRNNKGNLPVYDRFRHRIMFPIVNTKQEVVGFGGRLFADDPSAKEQAKYVNSSQSMLFDKSRNFYLLDQAVDGLRQAREVVVVEGYLDAIALHQHGMTHVVATLGTALTEHHGRLLSRFADRVITLFDGDDAGVRAAKRTLAPLLQSSIDAALVLLPVGEDPDTFVRSKGAEKMQELLAKPLDLLDFVIRSLQKTAPTKRALAAELEDIAAAVGKVPSRIQRDMLMKQFAETAGISPGVVGKKGAEKPLNRPSAAKISAENDQITSEEELLICLAFDNENVYELLRTYEGPPAITHPLIREILEEQFVGGERNISKVLDSIQDEAVKKRFERQMLAVEQIESQAQMQAARDCLRKILRKRFEKRMRELSQAISVAEQNRDMKTVTDLLKQKKDLLKTAQTEV